MTIHPQNLLDFTGKTVVVTGASQGIGAGIALRFAQTGAKVIVHYRTNKTGADETVSIIKSDGGEAFAIDAELSSEEGSKKLIEQTLHTYGKLDVMVNNAGIFPNNSLLDLNLADWQNMYKANLDTAFLCTQAAARHMKNNDGGSIVNLGSIAALNPGADHSHYNSAKAAVAMLTRSAAQELGPFNIRVNTVSPGLISRPGIEEQWPDGVNRWQTKVPLGRLGTPEDIADACLFFASPASRWITGQHLLVDGGMINAMIY